MNRFIYALIDINTDELVVHRNEILYIYKDDKYKCSVISITHGIEFDVLFENIDNKIIDKNFYSYFNPSQTGDNFPNKVCNVCHRLLPTERFEINQHGLNNRIVRRPSCIFCREVINGVQLSNNERQLWNSKKPYMIPFECPICKKRTIPGLTSKVVLDHNHNTGKGRAWICDSCNTGLGRFKDNIDLLKSAINFLETN
ncbi:MAG: endonuclease VII domain-containing protein [Treponema sp.]|nr:endonuclease VII domain-containing protein [Treponema sp.]MCL2251052.1 endonuclease VII domain-containing protein [Treponema sp.]